MAVGTNYGRTLLVREMWDKQNVVVNEVSKGQAMLYLA